MFLYHRVASPRFDPFALSVSAGQFQDHLDILLSSCSLVSVDELLETRRASRGVLASITFDDGYSDNLTTAVPILRQAGVPATFFICTGYLGEERGFWWDRVASATAATEHAPPEIELAEVRLPVDLGGSDARRRTALEFAGRLQRMQPGPRDRAVEELESVLLAGSSGQREPCPILDEAGVRELASQALAQVGAHTHHHPMLSVLTPDEQLAEIDGSAARLQEITGVRPRLAAYPYGSERDYNDHSLEAARAASMDAAFVNHGAAFDPRRYPYRIPRYYVPPLPGDAFRRWVQQVIRR